MDCLELNDIFSAFYECATTNDGVRLKTHCLYPSFTPVEVFIDCKTDGFQVHDAGNAYASAWDHGRDRLLIDRCIEKAARKNSLVKRGAVLSAHVPDKNWLMSAILAVANGSSQAANNAVDRIVAAAEKALKDRIGDALSTNLVVGVEVQDDFVVRGASGKQHTFDFAVLKKRQDRTVLMDAVSSHHNSIASKFLAFSDTKSESHNLFDRIAVYDRKLGDDDIALLEKVADLVQFKALSSNAPKVLAYE